ncbi:MAG: orotate phosphoribosyltransferase [Methanocalculus sp. MSAO_Arc1]|uniref:orotate phosphoribosyltransferase n=1 Tax=Methanocalculus TaxID=71151 RepID=UPI000FF41790|nr:MULTISPECIES: orotate phosphoribosyltransferase [unclassified Methanocalculus]MCP1662833.1 orotate phosphoribosyltransferase [Methanocalculus sp. AMF5]RQD79003.1 MAG: orotate phosphoribosyltransferase [Methanocalculus sp. MSAO_Arc1]
MVDDIAQMLIRHRAIEFGDFTLASGQKSTYYVDIKHSVTEPALLSALGRAVAERFEFDVIAGVAVGGVPLAVSVSLASNKPYAIIRATDRDHGKAARVIGDVKGKRVLLIEDVTTSGGSAIYGVEELRKAGAVIDRVVTIVDREQGAESLLARHGVALLPLTRVSELMNT